MAGRVKSALRRSPTGGGLSVKLDQDTTERLERARSYYLEKPDTLEEEAELAMAKLLIRRRSQATVNPFVRRRYSYMRFEDAAHVTRSTRFKNAAMQALELERLNQARQRISLPYIGQDPPQQPPRGSERRNSKKSKVSGVEPPPYIRRFKTFRGAARAILLVIKVCIAVRELLSNKIKGERWMMVMDNVLISASRDRGKRQIFRAKYMDDDTHDILEVSFDFNLFRRDFVDEEGLTARARDALDKVPGVRTEEEIREILSYMRGLSTDFRSYPREVQRRLCEVAFFDKFADNRVIIQQGTNPDGFYFVITGTVAEQSQEHRDPRLFTAGSKFGEQDLICGCHRRTTAVTKSYVELLYIHRLDYGIIFNLCNPTATIEEISGYMRHPVFAQFPVHRLIENPGTWNIVPFKVNQLIADDSNRVDWIYVIIQGQAKVLRTMETRSVEMNRQRRNTDDDEGMTYRLLDFESVCNATPGVAMIHRLLVAKSAHSCLPVSEEDDDMEAKVREITSGIRYRSQSRFPITHSRPRTSPGYLSSARSSANTVPVPPFLQLEQLGPGQAFGLRSCLQQEERGPSCSLVSAGCTMLLINRRFFAAHLDTFKTGLIRLYVKAYPTESEVLENLNSNLIWEDFKGNTLRSFVMQLQHRRSARLQQEAGT